MISRVLTAVLCTVAAAAMPNSAFAKAARADKDWRPVSAPPCYPGASTRNAAACDAPAPEFPELAVDPASSRWLFSAKGARRAKTPMPPRTTHFLFDLRLGLIAIQDRRMLWRAADPLGPLVRVGMLPEYLDPRRVDVHHGALNAIGWQGPFWSTDAIHWQRIGPFGDRAPALAKIGADGNGLVVFFPQKIGITHDGGRSFTALPADDLLATALMTVDPRTVAVGALPPDRAYLSPPGTQTRCWKVGSGAWQACSPADEKKKRRESRRRGRPGQTVGRRDDYTRPEVVVGDTVFAHFETPKPQVLRRRIGEPWSNSRPSLACGDNLAYLPQISACGKTVVVFCNGAIEVERAGVRRTMTPKEPIEGIALASPNQLWAVTDDEKLLSLDLGRSSFKVVASLSRGWSSDGRLVSSCSPHRPAGPLYILNESRKVVRGAIDPSSGSGLRMFTSEPPTISALISPAVDSHGRLVYATATPEPRLVRVSLDGRVEEMLLPGELASSSDFYQFPGPQVLSSLRDGKALLVDKYARAFQTLDDGTSWQPVPGPFPAHGEQPHVLCGATRCEVDASVYRQGWPARNEPVGNLDPGPPPASFYLEPPRPTDLGSCKPVAPLGACDEPLVFARGIGSAIFSGICLDKAGKDQVRYFSFHGFPDRRVMRRPFVGFDRPTTIGWQGFLAPSFLGLELQSPTPRSPSTPREPSWLVDEGLERPAAIALEPPAEARSLFDVEEGFVHVEEGKSELAWRHAGGAVERRALGQVRRALDFLADAAMGTLVVDQRGDWVGAVLHPAAAAYSGILLLFRLPRGGEPAFRWQVVKAPQQLEWGLGLTLRDGIPNLASLEWTATDSTLARLRPIGPDLSLGDAIDLEGGSARAGHLMAPPACPAGTGQGGHMTTSSLHTYTLSFPGYRGSRLGPEPEHDLDLPGYVAAERIVGPVIRDLRIRDNTICAMRTAIGSNTLAWYGRRRSAALVAAGNGRGAAAVATHWVSCDFTF
jgi:hypothetical protein